MAPRRFGREERGVCRKWYSIAGGKDVESRSQSCSSLRVYADMQAPSGSRSRHSRSKYSCNICVNIVDSFPSCTIDANSSVYRHGCFRLLRIFFQDLVEPNLVGVDGRVDSAALVLGIWIYIVENKWNFSDTTNKPSSLTLVIVDAIVFKKKKGNSLYDRFKKNNGAGNVFELRTRISQYFRSRSTYYTLYIIKCKIERWLLANSYRIDDKLYQNLYQKGKKS